MKRNALLNLYKKCAATLLDGLADTGMVEISDVELAAYHADKKFAKQPFFRNGKFICHFLLYLSCGYITMGIVLIQYS